MYMYIVLTAMNYRILVVGEGKHFGLSTACLYVTLAGEYSMTDVIEMPRGEYQTETTVSISTLYYPLISPSLIAPSIYSHPSPLAPYPLSCFTPSLPHPHTPSLSHPFTSSLLSAFRKCACV